MDMKFLRESFVLLLFMILFCYPLSADSAPFYPILESNSGSFQLFYYWDQRDRKSTVQVFNASASPIRIHVQIFVANSTGVECRESDFFDDLTSFDSHIYDLRNIQSNTGLPTGIAPMPDGTFGFLAITMVDAAGSPIVSNPVLQGSFRIIDEAGYEYRSSPAGLRSAVAPTTDTYSFNFNTLGSTTFSDVVGIPIVWSAPGFGIPIAGPNIGAKFNPFIFDEDESDVSCTPVTFSCSATGMNRGINIAIPNTKDNSRMCVTTTPKGLINLQPPVPFGLDPSLTQAQLFIGFIGLNNGSNMGSMESFIAVP